MKAVEFPEVNVRLGEGQPQYETLPACAEGGREGRMTMCFALDEAELAAVKQTGKIWLTFLTFGSPFQPLAGTVLRPDGFTEVVEVDEVVATDAEAPYGYCPKCLAPGRVRERRPDGDDTCEKGHHYPSAKALSKPVCGECD